MGFGEKIKNIYFAFEDKWYAVLDKLNNTIPVYKIIDPVDKVIPSFILFLLILLFIIISMGYFVRFTSPYEVTFTTYDSESRAFLSGVALTIEVGDETFNERTNSKGEAEIFAEGISRNSFDVITQLLFSQSDTPNALVSTRKDGYIDISAQEIDLSKTTHKLYLQKVPDNAPAFPSSTLVELYGSSTSVKLIDQENRGEVKFNCNNKTIATKTVKDNSDGTIDGIYKLDENNCEFVLKYAYFPEYQTLSISQILPSTTAKHRVDLTKVAAPTTGSAKVFVYESGTTPKQYLPGISVTLTSIGNPRTGVTGTTGVAEINTLNPGVYTVTISDANYYAITPDNNIFITITASNVPSEIEVGLEKVLITDIRQVYLKVLDTNDTPVPNAKIDLVWIHKDANGDYIAASNGSFAVYKTGPSNTDSNGLFKVSDLTVRNDGNIMAIVKKDGYLYNLFKPTFFKIGEGPETIILERADNTNSGRAKVNVTSASNKPLYKAETTLYRNFFINGIAFNSIPLEKKFTNITGDASYSELPAGMGNYYSASAVFDNIASTITQKYSLSADQNIIIPVKVDLNASYLTIRLFDFSTRTQIVNQSSASVKLYIASNSSFATKQLTETLAYSTGKFVSSGYEKSSIIQVAVDLNNYVIENLFIDGAQNTLKAGENVYNLYLIPKSMLTSNVELLYENIYNKSDNPWSGITTAQTIDANGEYYVKFKAVIAKDINYQQVISLARISTNTGITNIFAFPQTEERDAFTCTTTSMDTQATHDNNYYFPSGTECKTSGAKYLQSGFRWGDGNEILTKGVYDFVIQIKVSGTAADNDKVSINYRAKDIERSSVIYFESAKKEVNLPVKKASFSAVDTEEKSDNYYFSGSSGAGSSTSFETTLKTLDFYVGQAIFNGVFYTTKINSTVVPFTANVSEKVNVTPNTPNPLSFKILNNTRNAMNNVTVTLYSHEGIMSGFNETSSGTGSIKFEGINGNSKMTFPVSSIGALSSKEYTADLYTDKFNSQTYLVIVVAYGSDKNILFVDIGARGLDLLLDAEFLGGVTDQLVDGIVHPSLGSETPSITNVTLKAYTDCRTSDKTQLESYTLTSDSPEVIANTFKKIIEGTYQTGIDCLEVGITATGESFSYNPLNATLYAGSDSSQDPSLACIDVRTSQGEAQDIYLEWEDTEIVNIVNTCSQDIKVKVETGVVCATTGGLCSNEFSISKLGGEKSFTVTGKNITYLASVTNSDVLGYFPFVVKAKLLDNAGTSRKRYAIADEIGIHVENPDKCFFISKDVFNFNEDENIDFAINNLCQYNDMNDYFVPKTALEAFGVSLDDTKPEYSAITFDWELVATGEKYTTSYTSEVNEYWTASYDVDINTNNSIDLPAVTGAKLYYGIKVDLTAIDNNVTELFYKWSDTPDGDYYGAKIDGNIKITYFDDTVEMKNPTISFELGDDAKCVCNGIVSAGSCGSGKNYCVLGTETLIANTDYGIMHIGMNNKKIKELDFNLIGNADTNNLSVRVMPRINVIEQTPHFTVTPGASDQTFNSGSFTIYPIEGATYVLRNIAQDTGSGLTWEESYCKESRGGKAWILSGDKIYWVDPYYTSYDSASSICAQTNSYTNIFGQSGQLAGYNATLLALLNSNISDFSWLAGDGNYGLWTSNCSGNTCTAIVKGATTFTQGTANKAADSLETKMLAPLCEKTVPAGFAFDEATCIANSTIVSGTTPPIYQINTTHNENNFFVSGYLNMVNPRVKFIVDNVHADGNVLKDTAVVMWIEGKYLKARFLGDDYAPHSDGSIELNLTNDFSSSTQYGIINIIDYIHEDRRKN